MMAMDCLILGDSIAVGTAIASPDCLSAAQGGINTANFLKLAEQRPAVKELSYNRVIISLGTNDSDNMDTEGNLRRLRESVTGKQVFWVLPSATLRPRQRQSVMRIATEFRDATISIEPNWLGSDRIHPTMPGYRKIAEQAR
jgi:lysophospholipase L1-like esterase